MSMCHLMEYMMVYNVNFTSRRWIWWKLRTHPLSCRDSSISKEVFECKWMPSIQALDEKKKEERIDSCMPAE